MKRNLKEGKRNFVQSPALTRKEAGPIGIRFSTTASVKSAELTTLKRSLSIRGADFAHEFAKQDISVNIGRL